MKKLLFSNNPISQDLGLLLIRLSAGGIMAYSHGWDKLQSLMAGNMKFADPIGIGEEASLVLAVFAEFFCGILVAVGLFTRAALIPLIITMWVAVFMIHGNDPFGKQEFGLLYLIPYLALYFTGPGKYSIDKQLL